MEDQFFLGRLLLLALGLVHGVYSIESATTTKAPLSTTKGPASPFFNVVPVKVKSEAGKPLLAFYMINSSLQPKIEVYMESDFTVSFDFSIICVNRNISMVLNVKVYNEDNLRNMGANLFPVSCKNAEERNVQDVYSTPIASRVRTETIPPWPVYVTKGQFNVNLRSGMIGVGTVEFSLLTINESASNVSYVGDGQLTSGSTSKKKFVIQEASESYRTLTYTIYVIRKIRPVDKLFQVVIYCVQVFVAMGFGCKLDLGVVRENIVRPIAPGMGMACQYLLMPLIAFAVAKAVPIDMKAVSLGIFVAGCCPGGGGSNMYSYLLKGDLSLSITMTALSTIFALAMLPFWLYTLGTQFSEAGELSIPFEMVAVSLSILITPLLVGLIIRQKFPKVAKKIQKVLKPVIILISIVLLVVGIISNMYIFKMFKPRVILAGCLLPYVGYLSGGLVALIFRQPWKRIKTIALETGMQNTNIAYILLTNSFPAPFGDIAAVGPVASAVMTPLPPFTVTIFYLLYQRFCKKNEDKEKESDAVGETENKLEENGDANKDGECEALVMEKTETKANDRSRETSVEEIVAIADM